MSDLELYPELPFLYLTIVAVYAGGDALQRRELGGTMITSSRMGFA